MAQFSVKQIKALLADAGLPVDALDNTAEEICARHNAALDSIKEERDSLKADAETLASTQKELAELKAAAKDDGFKAKYEHEHEAFEKYKADVAHKAVIEAKRTAFMEILKDAGITRDTSIAKVLKYTDVDKLGELDESGKFTDAKAILKAVKDEWPEHITTEGKQGAPTPTPPAKVEGGAFEQMSLADKMKFANEHPEDPGVRAWLGKK